MYFNTGDLALYIYDGAWKKVTQSSIVTYKFPGSNDGYAHGGKGSGAAFQSVDKWSFSSDGNASSSHTAYSSVFNALGTVQSTSHGYTVSGATASSWAAALTYSQKYAFASTTTAQASTGYTAVRKTGTTQSSTAYYMMGSADAQKDIQKATFAADGTASDVGDMLATAPAGGNYQQHTIGLVYGDTIGYTCSDPSSDSIDYHNKMNKFTFASEGNSTVMSTTFPDTTMYLPAPCSSETDGYIIGGSPNLQGTGTAGGIRKFVFATEANVTDGGGDLVSFAYTNNGNSSTTNGYIYGTCSGSSGSNQIQKFSFPGSSNSTDIGDLSVAHTSRAPIPGSQH
tara:strand:+ start:190 stop:1209 length:1020 start_codon:yes stop_codon:yes gene_type:complete